jgi:hypothetical protein
MKRQIWFVLAVAASTALSAIVWGRGAASDAGPATTTRTAKDELRAKHEALLASETAVTPEMLQEIVALDVRVNPPTTPQGSGFSSIITIYNMPGYAASFAKFGGELARALVGKQAEARGTCVVTLLKTPGQLAPADQEKVRPWVPGVLAPLSKEDVTNVLNSKWLMAKSPELLPVLLKMYDALPDEQVSPGKYGASEERNALLRRAYELSPEQVRPRVLAAIKDPGGRFDELWMTSLLGLPDRELPEMDEAFRAMVNAPRGAESVPFWVWPKLVGRYGTAKIEQEVKGYFAGAPGRWACEQQAWMLAYFLRVDPDYGRQAFAQCLATRAAPASRCWGTQFNQVAALIWTPELESLAIAALDDRDAEVPGSAAQALRLKGSRAAKEALLAALGRAYVPNPPRDSQSPKNPENARRGGIVRALLQGHAWVLTPEELAAVEAQALDKDLVEYCRSVAAQTEISVNLALQGSGTAALSVGGERYDTLDALESKVSLYPAGTIFKVEGAADDPVRQAFVTWARERKLIVK